jgi:hypothetical protein
MKYREQRLREKQTTLKDEQLRRASLYIEHLLFVQQLKSRQQHAVTRTTTTSSNLGVDMHNYADPTNLKARLAPLLHTLVQRKAAKYQYESASRQRAQLLQQSMATGTGGNETSSSSSSSSLYATARHTLQNIRRLRFLAASHCGGFSISTTTTTTTKTKGISIPPAVHTFFFDIRLERAMVEWSAAQVIPMTPADWTALIQQAVQAIRDYQDWQQNNNTTPAFTANNSLGPN